MTLKAPPHIIQKVAKLTKRGQYAEAIAACKTLTDEYYGDPRFLRMLAHCYAAQGKFRSTFQTIDLLCDRFPQEEQSAMEKYFGRGNYLADGLTRRRDVALLIASFLLLPIAAQIWGSQGLEPMTAVVAGAAAALLLAEGISRLWAWRRFGMKGEGLICPKLTITNQYFSVYDQPIFEFNETRSFDHRPNLRAAHAAIIDGRVDDAGVLSTNRLGNIEPSDDSFSDDTLNVLVVGDSFTALSSGTELHNGTFGVEWPYFLKGALEQHFGAGKVRVINYARNSAGLFQMMDIAAEQTRALKPHVVLFAFITRDVDRPRRYVSWRNVNGQARQFTHMECSAKPDLLDADDMIIIEPEISLEWAQELARTGGSDPLLERVKERVRTFGRRSSGRSRRFADFKRSFALDLALTGTVFTSFERWTAGRVLPEDYSNDPRFIEGIKTLRASGAQVHYIHLPEGHELERKEFMFRSDRSPDLLTAFVKAVGSPIFSLMGLIHIPEGKIGSVFNRKTYDRHPSMWIKQAYGTLIARKVVQDWKRRQNSDASISGTPAPSVP